jgi:hypothetical protein
MVAPGIGVVLPATVTLPETVPVVVTVKATPLLACPATVTITGPVVAPLGTGTEILFALQAVGVAAMPLNVTVLVPCVAPKVVPVIVMASPDEPEVGLRLSIFGSTMKLAPLLATPPTVTTTAPVVAPPGTGTVMLASLQFDGVAAVPLNVTVLGPCVAPKFTPDIVTTSATAPDVGERLLILGATVNVTPLLANPPTVNTTGPVVAGAGTVTVTLLVLQAVGDAVTPLKVTELAP